MGKARVTPSAVWLSERLIKPLKMGKYHTRRNWFFWMGKAGFQCHSIFLCFYWRLWNLLKVSKSCLWKLTSSEEYHEDLCLFFSKSKFDLGPRYVMFLQKLFKSKISNFKVQDSCCKGWRECLLTTLTENQRKDASEKNCDQNKKPSRVVIEDSQLTSIVPEPSDHVAGFLPTIRLLATREYHF